MDVWGFFEDMFEGIGDFASDAIEYVIPGKDDRHLLDNLMGGDDVKPYSNTEIDQMLEHMDPSKVEQIVNERNALISQQGGSSFGGGGGTPQFIKSIGDALGFGGSSGLRDVYGQEGIGGLLPANTLVQLAMAEYLRKRDNEKTYAPVGGEAYGDTGNLTDYRVNNLIPALMPGVAYGNVGGASQETDLTSAKIGMRQGGIASLSDKEGPGDVTLARLEPGEFVMTRKATQNIGAKNLYDMMRKAERIG
mgnify:FL=1